MRSTTPSDVGTLWTMRRSDRRARCALLSWPEYWELRVLIDGNASMAKRCPDTDEAFALAEEWKHRLLRQGWQQIVPEVSRR